MKNQALFSLKDKSKKKCHLLQFLFGALRVNNTMWQPVSESGIYSSF